MASTVNLGQIDDRIEELGTALDKVESELVELDGDDYRRLLAATPLTGDTATRWTKADADAQLAWKWFLAVKDWLAAIVEKRGTRSSISAELREQLINDLARTPAEILPGAPAPGRTSTGGAAPASIDGLLQATLRASEQASAVVARVAAIWQGTSPKLAALESESRTLGQQATQAGVRAPNELAVARRLLAEVRTRCTGDPLSIDPKTDPTLAIAAGLERARAAVQDVIASRQHLSEETSATIAEIDEAISALSRARAKEQESAEKISGSTALAEIEPAAAELGRLHDELLAIQSETSVDVSVRALAALRGRSAAALDRARSLAAAGGASLAQRNELRGRLDAYRAKALAIGRAEDAELDSLYRQAMDALFTAPCDLRHSESLVLAYQRALGTAHRAVDA
ncbi:MAG: hypothetical protein ACLP8S_07245 [Solirubrobacteraceae bacterium]